MKVYEILKLTEGVLKTLQDSCIKIGDIDYLQMYDDYVNLIHQKHKKSYVIAVLSDRYKVSERQVYYVIRRFSKECKIRA